VLWQPPAALALSAPAAHASVNAGTVNTTNEAGWQAHGNGWNFRYLQDTVTLPDVTGNVFKTAFASYGASLRLANGNQILDLGISTTTSSGDYNGGFAVEYKNLSYACINGASPVMHAGDTVKMTLFYDYTAGVAHYSIADGTNHTSFTGTCADLDQFFGSAQVVAGFAVNDWSAPSPAVNQVPGNVRLVQFRNTVVTSRTGTRSSIGYWFGSLADAEARDDQ